MKHNTVKKSIMTAFADRLGTGIAAAAIGGAMIYLLMYSFGCGVTLAFSFMCACASCLILAVVCTSPIMAGAVLAAAAGAVIFAVRRGNTPWAELMVIISELSSEDAVLSQVLTQHTLFINIVSSVACGIVCYAFARMQGGVYPLITMALAEALVSWYTAEAFLPACIFTELAGLIILFGRSINIRISWRRIIPIALIAALISCAVIPPAGTVWQPMADAAQKVRDIIDAYFRFNSPRTGYTVAIDGYQPMGERLGGPASPSEEEVMTVATDKSLLLRGSIKRTYLGYGWTDSTVNNRYLYISPSAASYKSALFGSGIYSGTDITGAFDRVSIDVCFLKEATSSLFVPDILNDLSAPLEEAVYFNDTGEVFLTRDVGEGDIYSAQGLSPIHGEALAELIASRSTEADARYETIRADYTILPDGIEKGVYSLTRDVVSGCQSPYEAACAICDYLKSNYRYRLDADYPPYGSDFVSYFLLNSREGYCTYFATAMAVMARMVGLPSRYVEGYRVTANDTGLTVVTGLDAHAWVEIYFRGAGWIAFDPTAGAEAGGDADGNDSPSNEPTPEPSEEPEPTPTPEPTQEPTQEPTLPPDGLETQEPDGEPTPPPESETETPEPQAVPTGEPDDDGKQGSFPWLILLLILLFILIPSVLFALRERATRPSAAASKEGTDEGKLMIWYRAVLSALECMGLGVRGGETPVTAAERLVSIDDTWQPYLLLAEITAACRYSECDPNEQALRAAERAYECVLEHMDMRTKIRWTVRRVMRGTGDWHVIPS